MSDLFAIGTTGVRAYQTALGTTSENIANAGVAGYSRRVATMKEVSQTSNAAYGVGARLNGNGVAVTGVTRAGDMFRVAQARTAGSDLAKTEGGIVWMERTEAALTGNKLSERLTGFFSAADQVAADPAAIAPRAVFLEKGRALAAAFDATGQALDAAAAELAQSGQDAATRLTDLSASLVKVNGGLAKAEPNSIGQAQLLDERDRLLEGMAALVDIDVQADQFGRATVRAGGSNGPVVADPSGSSYVTFAVNASGAVSLAAQRTGPAEAIAPHGGMLAGLVDGAARIAGAREQLNDLAVRFTGGMTTLQAAGRDLDGAPGAPMFAAGASPTQISLVLDDPRKLAVAAPGEGARGNGNFADLADWREAQRFEADLDDVTSANAAALAARRDVASAQGSIREAAVTARDSYSAVDLDEEAVNLIRFQQAYQASSRVIQVARDILQTIIDIR